MPVAPAPPRYANLCRLIFRCPCNSSAHVLIFSWPRKCVDYASLFIFRRCSSTHFVSCYIMGDSLSVRPPHRYRYSSLPSESQPCCSTQFSRFSSVASVASQTTPPLWFPGVTQGSVILPSGWSLDFAVVFARLTYVS